MQVAANQRNSHPMYIFHLSLPEYRKFDYNMVLNIPERY